MQAVVEYLTGFNYMKFQPGDGTIYTVLYGTMVDDPDNMYIAIGPGDSIQGGYFFRKSSVEKLADRMVNWIYDDGRPLAQFMTEEYYVDYQHTKLAIYGGNRWTTAVAVLFAMVYAMGNVAYDKHLNVIGHVYRNNREEVLKFFKEIGFLLLEVE